MFRACRATQVRRATLVLPARPAHRVSKVIPGRQVQPALLQQSQAQLAQPVIRVQPVRKVLPATPAPQDRRVRLDRQDRRARLALLE